MYDFRILFIFSTFIVHHLASLSDKTTIVNENNGKIIINVYNALDNRSNSLRNENNLLDIFVSTKSGYKLCEKKINWVIVDPSMKIYINFGSEYKLNKFIMEKL